MSRLVFSLPRHSFDRQIQVDKPDIKGRADIFKVRACMHTCSRRGDGWTSPHLPLLLTPTTQVHLKPLKLAGQMQEVANRMAALTPGFTGADICNICNEAAIVAARGNKTAVDLKDFEVGIQYQQCTSPPFPFIVCPAVPCPALSCHVIGMWRLFLILTSINQSTHSPPQQTAAAAGDGARDCGPGVAQAHLARGEAHRGLPRGGPRRRR